MFTIEPYRPEYLDGCAEVFRDAFGQPPWGQSWSSADAHAFVEDLVGVPGFADWVALEEGSVVGMAMGHRIVRWDGAELMVDEFCVCGRAQGRGVGSALLERVKADAIASGLLGIALSTRADAPAARFYEVRGFRRAEWLIFMNWSLAADDGPEAREPGT